MTVRTFSPRGLLALEPAAYGLELARAGAPAPSEADGVAVVTIRGPLMHHEDPDFDSYDAIRARVAAALSLRPRALVLSIDSPGGLVAGCFEAAAHIRGLSQGAGVPLFAYVDGSACSAAYALACAADWIGVPSTGAVGSVGVIEALVDAREQAAMMGLRFAVVTSGDRKADGHPHAGISDGALAASQSRVDALARVFWEHVAGARGLGVEAVQALEAGVFVGADAVARRLADEVCSFGDLLSRVASGAITGRGGGMSEEEKREILAKLRAAAEDGDEDASRMLAALEPKEEPEASDEGEEPKEEPKEQPEASARVAATTAAAVAAVAVSAEARLAALEARLEASERSEVLASRPDLPAELVRVLAGKPVAEVRAIVAAIPRKKSDPAAVSKVLATRGAGQGDGAAARLAPDAKAALDAAMGLTTMAARVEDRGTKLVLGVSAPVKG